MFRILAGAAIAAVCIVANGSERPVPPGNGTMAPGMGLNADGAKRQMAAPNAHRQGVGSGRRMKSGRRGGSSANRSRWERQDRALLDAIEDADSIAALSRLITQAMRSQNPEVRQAMVDALADKGRKGANGLAYFINDPDDDVAESAFSAWVSALEEHGTSGRVAAIISAAGIIQQNSSHGGMQAGGMQPGGMQPGGMQAPYGAPPPPRH